MATNKSTSSSKMMDDVRKNFANGEVPIENYYALLACIICPEDADGNPTIDSAEAAFKAMGMLTVDATEKEEVE